MGDSVFQLYPQPDIAIISGSLRLPIPDVLTAGGRKFVVFNAASPDPARVAEIEHKGGLVAVVGDKRVDGAQLVQKMAALGYQTVYSAAGPKVLHLLLAGGVLNRLYLTQVNRILGGEPFSSIVEGSLLETAVNLQTNAIYHDPKGADGVGQLFASYDLKLGEEN